MSPMDSRLLYQLRYPGVVPYMKPTSAIGRKCLFETRLRTSGGGDTALRQCPRMASEEIA